GELYRRLPAAGSAAEGAGVRQGRRTDDGPGGAAGTVCPAYARLFTMNGDGGLGREVCAPSPGGPERCTGTIRSLIVNRRGLAAVRRIPPLGPAARPYAAAFRHERLTQQTLSSMETRNDSSHPKHPR